MLTVAAGHFLVYAVRLSGRTLPRLLLPVTGDERVLYWCEECGTELVLLVRGSGDPPRHCMAKMHERAELLSN